VGGVERVERDEADAESVGVGDAGKDERGWGGGGGCTSSRATRPNYSRKCSAS
jgi:hypothetical protein